ncbi:unnamed protein product [Cuscuta epithymum]|uniref:Uncharacterized protein n=1 Tax=Cuscuta epithymum TaxID=186058 RepID=A0AAV0DJI6_9ASTE|nr:unnamed protein product [Cuscuta epithymum]
MKISVRLYKFLRSTIYTFFTRIQTRDWKIYNSHLTSKSQYKFIVVLQLTPKATSTYLVQTLEENLCYLYKGLHLEKEGVQANWSETVLLQEAR